MDVGSHGNRLTATGIHTWGDTPCARSAEPPGQPSPERHSRPVVGLESAGWQHDNIGLGVGLSDSR